MFVREKTSPTTKHKYLQILKSYREEGKVKQRVVASLGCIEDLKERNELRNVAFALLNYLRDKPIIIEKDKIKEIRRVIWGADLCYRRIWEGLKIGEIIKGILADTRIKIDIEKTTYLMCLEHLIRPMSKLSTYENRIKIYGEWDISLHHLYRTLDILSKNKERIEEGIFFSNRDLFNNSCDVVFYDTTTLYYESQRESSLLRYGYSKDGKFNNVQIVLGLLIDRESRPFGFDVFSGNTFDSKTLPEVLSKLRERFNLRKVIIVSDKGIFSDENLKRIVDKDFSFIISARIRNLSKENKDEIRDIKRYKLIKGVGDDKIFIYETRLKGYRLICSYSTKRAAKDAFDREEAIKKIKEKISNGEKRFITNSSYRQFIRLKSEQVEINEKNVLEDESWDGFSGIITNDENLSSETIISEYHNLSNIEESFRIMKSHLETRPMFHWTESRIKGHLMVCFISFLLLRQLEKILKDNGKNYSPQDIRQALNDLQLSEILIENKSFLLRSAISGIANEILRSLKIKIPPSLEEGKLP